MNYETLKAAVANVIKTNGNEEITGQLLQDVLIAIINALGSGYQFMGIATAETTPGTPDQRVFYLAGSAGSTVLPGFGITVDHEICVLMYSDEWEKQTLLQFDSVLTSGSQNLVTSGMVYDAVANLTQAINGLAEIVGGHTTAIESLQETVGGHTTAIESLQETVGGHTTAIESLQETVGGHTTAINNLQYAVIAIQAAIESLQADVAQKIDKSDADSLVVGSAQGVLATSAVEAFFLFQQSGATGNGAALIPTIKGCTKAINQLVDDPTTPITLLNGHTYLFHDGTPQAWRIVTRTSTTSYNPSENNCDSITDLTLAGFADYTLAQILALYPNGFGAYNAGVLKSNDAAALITDGRNQWDEEWENGTFDTTTGANISNDQVRSKNLIPVFPNTVYYADTTNISGAQMWAMFYDAGGNIITDAVVGAQARSGNSSRFQNNAFTTPAAAAFMKFYLTGQYGTTYKNDICVNLSDASFNGTYEPYWTRKVNLGLDAIKVKSPNIWDEQWEVGGLNSETGGDYPSTTKIRSKNYIPLVAGQTYYAKAPSVFDVCYYDADKQFVRYLNITNNTTFVVPDGVAYMRFGQQNSYGTTYNNDICINLSAAGINGKYFPHGILTYHGLDGAGTAFDFIFKDANGIQKLQKTMLTEIDLGDSDWSKGTYTFFTILEEVFRPNLICSKYVAYDTEMAGSAMDDKTIAKGSGNVIYIKDSAYADAATFKAAMAGVKLIAEAAEPAIFELAEPIPDTFLTAQGGTMLIVSPEGATAPSAPFSADIIYPVDPIASSGASLKNLLEALKTATVITSYTMTFNSTTQQYEFTITK